MATIKTDEKLREYSEHLYYEIWMFIGTSKILGETTETRALVRNAVMESFLIHARGLRDFVTNHGTQPTDVHAKDFIPNWAPPILSEISTTQINKQIAHLTENRTHDVEKKKWEFAKITDELREALRIFIQQCHQLNPRMLSDEFKTKPIIEPLHDNSPFPYGAVVYSSQSLTSCFSTAPRS